MCALPGRLAPGRVWVWPAAPGTKGVRGKLPGGRSLGPFRLGKDSTGGGGKTKEKEKGGVVSVCDGLLGDLEEAW